jgi:predicted dehydrogenase
VGDYGSDPRAVLSWRFLRDQAGLGVLGDVMSHAVDMALMLAGPVVSATAVDRTLISRRPRMATEGGTHFSVAEGGELADVENEDYVLSIVRFASGLVGSLCTERAARSPGTSSA